MFTFSTWIFSLFYIFVLRLTYASGSVQNNIVSRPQLIFTFLRKYVQEFEIKELSEKIASLVKGHKDSTSWEELGVSLLRKYHLSYDKDTRFKHYALYCFRQSEDISNDEKILKLRLPFRRGIILSSLGYLSEAQTEFRKSLTAVKESSDKSILYYHMGKVFWESGNLTAAISHFEDSIRLSPSFLCPFYELIQYQM